MGGQLDWILMCTCAIMFLVSPTLTALPSQPLNLTITKLRARFVTITWEFPPVDDVTKFEMIYQTGDDLGHRRKVLMTLNKEARRHSLSNLEPDTNYEVYVIAYNAEGMGNVSSHVIFNTPPANTELERIQMQMNVGEIVLVMFLLLGWLTTIGLFLSKWGQIRSFQPREPRFKHNPKNLHTIQVVDHPTDSVIYKTYPRKLSKTMQAREKRLARMRTVPNIKILSDNALFKEEPERPTVKQPAKEDLDQPRRRSSSVTALDMLPGLRLATHHNERNRTKRLEHSNTYLRPVLETRLSHTGSEGAISEDNLNQKAAGDVRLPKHPNNKNGSLKKAPDVTGQSNGDHGTRVDQTAKPNQTPGHDETNLKLNKKDLCKDTINAGEKSSPATDALQSGKKHRKLPDSKSGSTPVLDQVALVSKTYPNDPNYANSDITSSNPPKVKYSSIPFLGLDEELGGGSPV